MKKLFCLLILCFEIASPAAYAQDEAEDLSDYKTACLAAIDNISKIGDNFSMRSMISIAKTSLNTCRTKDDMRRTMTALRAGVTSYLQTIKTFPDEQIYTGLLGNHSFDTGDLSTWYCVGFDLSQTSLTDITNAISGGDVSGLVNAVSVNNWNEGTKVVENEGANAIQGGHEKYYLNSTQLIMQPIIGLPAGIYSFSAKVACTPGLLKLNKVYLNALVIPTNVAQEVLGDILADGNWEELLSNFNLLQYMTPFLQNGKLQSGTVNCKNLTTLSDGELRFIIDKGDIVILGINAGMVPFIGTEKFRADNLQLTGLRAADSILTPAKADLAAALEGLDSIKANYNADLETTAVQPAFTYDKTITENYNNAYRTAKAKYDNDKLADLLTKNDLQNLDGIADALKNHYNSEISTLISTKEIFDKQAFIAPTPKESFNIVMKENWISLTTPKWTGNAITIDNDMALRFSQQPGESVFTLAFNFEKVSDEYTNQLHAFVDDCHSKYYLGEKNDSLVLTTAPSEAVTIIAIPSHTEEGNILLKVGDMYLGTSNASNVLVKTDTGTLLRPTRTGLAILPASEKGITITIPANRNAYTLMLPFDAELPEGINAYTVMGINEDKFPYIECENQTSLKANTPYIIMATDSRSMGEEWSETFIGIPHAILPSYGEGLLVGRHTPYSIQAADEYNLTVDEDEVNVFRKANGDIIAENECYLKYDSPNDVIFASQEDAATGIKGLTQPLSKGKETVIYNITGQRISKMQKGIDILSGKKILR